MRQIYNHLYFFEIDLFTIFNPAHLSRKLRKAGFTVKQQDQNPHKIVIGKKLGEDRHIYTENFQYFLWLIQQNLFTENSIVELLKRIEFEIVNKEIPLNSKIEMRIFEYV